MNLTHPEGEQPRHACERRRGRQTGYPAGPAAAMLTTMDFDFDCWACGASCAVWGKPRGFWTEWYELPEEWECWNCGAINSTPDDD